MVTLTLLATFLSHGSSPEESNLVKTVSRRQRMSEGLRSLDGPRLLASPTRTRRRPYREIINSEWPIPHLPLMLHLRPNIAFSLGLRSTLTSEQTGIPRPWPHPGDDPTPIGLPLVPPNLRSGPPPELSGRQGRTRLVVLAAKVGRRWSQETPHFLLHLAKAKVRHEPMNVRVSAQCAWLRRWQCMLACQPRQMWWRIVVTWASCDNFCEFLISFRRQCVTERCFSSFACAKKKKVL